MTVEQKQFIEKLNLQDLHVLESILKEDSVDFLNLVQKILMRSDLAYDILDLAEDIPMQYVPIFGINRINFFKSVSDYCNTSFVEKSQIRTFGPVKIARLDCAVDFLLQCLKNRVQLYRVQNIPVSDGQRLLDSHLDEKQRMVISQIGDIFHFLRDNGSDYIFNLSRDSLFEDRIHSNPNLHKLIEILARFSEIEDLQDSRIESFQKFIKK